MTIRGCIPSLAGSARGSADEPSGRTGARLFVALRRLAGAAAVVSLVSLVSLVSSAGCATTSHATKADAQLVVEAPIADARIYVDDVFAGRAAELRGRAILVRSGTRRVEVRADGYFTAYRDVAIATGARAAVSVALHPAPPNEQAE